MTLKDTIQNPNIDYFNSYTLRIKDELGEVIGLIQDIGGQGACWEFGDWLHIPNKKEEERNDIIATKVVFFSDKMGILSKDRKLIICFEIIGTFVDNGRYAVDYHAFLKSDLEKTESKKIATNILIYQELLFECTDITFPKGE